MYKYKKKEIIINDLKKYVGNEVLFECEQFRIKYRDRMGIVGNSGIGKTTFLNMLAGLDKKFDGIIENNFNRTFFVPQFDEFPNWLGVNYIIRRAKHLSKISDIQGNFIIDQLGLNSLFQQKYGTLSGGQRKVVLVGVALLSLPDLLILDEAFNGIDDNKRRELFTFLNKWIENNKITLIFVSHNKNDLALLTNKVIKIKNKRITF
ncbi:hypothetical protein JF75_03910 [Lactobacillus kimbladii]|uniref:ABC transporter domain-containing protein n=2 Tax=Lactobacillus TaxID=1578 RepID=A0A0F4LII8_9LACO|nr:MULTISPECIES: ATP-binding cassette domain-containing protein [Lactobacillus]KJY57376.1 hypothetical protein JF74_03990 [Lactobacillus melliventris]KJY59356.1 hypothetical protein JF75_03910 [Lactobacillus kimbladii]PXY83982.1 hypothetical protein DK873_02010 [Lactobacillus melliventris]